MWRKKKPEPVPVIRSEECRQGVHEACLGCTCRCHRSES